MPTLAEAGALAGPLGTALCSWLAGVSAADGEECRRRCRVCGRTRAAVGAIPERPAEGTCRPAGSSGRCSPPGSTTPGSPVRTRSAGPRSSR
ncbi:hypothetical protein ACU686_30930 [Yinghuangia aomiensis]